MSAAVSPFANAIAFAARLVSGANSRVLVPLAAGRQRIFFANHTSHLDSVVVWSLLPKRERARTRPIAAADYWGRGFLKPRLARNVFNSILIPRRASGTTDPDSIRDAARRAVETTAEAIGSEFSAIVFPEGTRGTGDDVAPFKSGLYFLAKALPDVDLVPVFIDNLHRILPKGEILIVPLLTRVTFGPPLERQGDEPRDEFLERARAALLALRSQ